MWCKMSLNLVFNCIELTLCMHGYTLSHLENDRDVSVYSRGRCLMLCALHVCYSHVQKRIPGFTHKWCVLQRISIGASSDVTVVLGMRQSIVCMGYGNCHSFHRVAQRMDLEKGIVKKAHSVVFIYIFKRHIFWSIFLSVSGAVGTSWTFLAYSVICGVSVLFVFLVVPETKNKSLEQISSDLKKG